MLIAQNNAGNRVPLKPEETGYAPLIDTFGNRQARIPVWWMLMHKLNKGGKCCNDFDCALPPRFTSDAF